MPNRSRTDNKAGGAMNDRKTVKYADQSVGIGPGGEVHQTATADTPILTTQQGIPVSDDQNSLKIGARGPTRPALLTRISSRP